MKYCIIILVVVGLLMYCNSFEDEAIPVGEHVVKIDVFNPVGTRESLVGEKATTDTSVSDPTRSLSPIVTIDSVVSKKAKNEISVTCPRLILRPISFKYLGNYFNCTEASIEAIRIWLLHDGVVVHDANYLCQDDQIILDVSEPGIYQLAAVSLGPAVQVYMVGIDAIRKDYYPNYPECPPQGRACWPLSVDLNNNEESVYPLTLYCNEILSGVIDSCGGA